MNNNKTLQDMLWVFIPKIAELISTKKKITLKDASRFIYNSETYKKLEKIDTKMWYYSDEALSEFFINEYDRRELYGV
ncbi:MAG: hypothetical protein IKF38_03320 [Clostridia bacterium]|nr:hypothetical protein [Clostridia bacterium]